MTTISKTKLAKLAKITIEHEPLSVPVKGNIKATDTETDREIKDQIRAELAKGNTWAWCTITVRASYDGLSARASLACRSYRDERAFRSSGDLTALRRLALDRLFDELVAREREKAAEPVSRPGGAGFVAHMAIVTRYDRRKIRVSSKVGHCAHAWDPALTAEQNYLGAAVAFAKRQGWLERYSLVGAALPGGGYAFIPVPKA